MHTYENLYGMTLNNYNQASITDKCIVLDIDQTLVYTFEEMNSYMNLDLQNSSNIDIRSRLYTGNLGYTDENGDYQVYKMWGIERPHLKEFLIFCFSYFKVVAVWSAGEADYVEKVVSIIFKDTQKPKIVFTRNQLPKNSKGELIWPLTKPLDDLFNYDAFTRANMNFKNTLILDDTESTFAYNVNNGVLCPRYVPKASISSLKQNDDTLLQFKYWLLQPEVIRAKDVRFIDKSTIFNVPITTYMQRLPKSTSLQNYNSLDVYSTNVPTSIVPRFPSSSSSLSIPSTRKNNIAKTANRLCLFIDPTDPYYNQYCL